MRFHEIYDDPGGSLIEQHALFEPPPGYFDPENSWVVDGLTDAYDAAAASSFDSSDSSDSSYPGARRSAVFAHFLDDAEAADGAIAHAMATRARRIDALREKSVANAAEEAAAEGAQSKRLRLNRHPESGWSIENRARTELATEIAASFRLSKNHAQRLITESATLVADLPLTLAALEEGRIRYEHAQTIVETALSLPRESRAELERELVPLASTLILTAFRTRAVSARERLHPEPMEERHEKAAEFRNLVVELGENGMGWLSLHASNEVLAAAYNRITDMALPKSKDDPRSLAHRRADVASEILLTGDLCAGVAEDAAAAKPLGHGIVAQVHVEVPVLTLLGIESAPATLEGRIPIDPVTARGLVGDAAGFFRVLTDPITGSVISFDDRFRFLPASLRRAVRLIDGTCTAPWCAATPNESEGHHPEEWSESHDTSLGNSALVCKPDHRLVHQSRWTMRKLPNGDKEWTSPCGRRYTVPALRRLSPGFVESQKVQPPQSAESEAISNDDDDHDDDINDEPLPF